MAIGLSQSVKSAQTKHVAVHAATQSQSAAWAAVMVFKEYLKTITYEEVEALQANANIALTINNVSQNLSAQVINIDTALKDSDGIKVTANIQADDASALSTSTIQVVYLIANASCTICLRLISQVDFFDETNLMGDINISAPPDTVTVVNVEGDVNALNLSLIGVSRLNATGDVVLGSAVPIEQVYTNGSLVLDGAASVGKASALGSVILSGNGRADVIYTNSDVLMGGGATSAVNSLGDVDVTLWALHDTIIAKGDVAVAAPVQTVHAQGDITLTQWADARDIQAEGQLMCVSPYWTMYDFLAAEMGMSHCPTASANVQPGANVSVPVMEPLQSIDFVRPNIDAWTVKSQANYAFSTRGNAIQVTVSRVNAIADGTYYLGRYPYANGRGYEQFLCDAVDGLGNCTSPAMPGRTLCQGHSTSNSCIAYDNATKTWTVNGRNIAPGVAWFEGNLTLSNGTYYNTFIVTQNIQTAGAMKTYAPNYVGYDVICNNGFPEYATSDFQGIYPTQLCDKTANTMIYSALTNIVMLAGGNNPKNGGAYEGGDITLGASNELFGTVLAGGYFDSNGDTTVHGYIAAAANHAGAGANDLGGSTDIILDNLPSTFKPNEVPLFDDSGTCSSSCFSQEAKAEVLWSRYL